ncbi:hypothetical protein [Flavobacterium cerinum]|uniref:Uncharacterized protein n=1 Tax=Flavobacterium cerinum TaxID=2502784 RepID=A0A3S3SGN9_9FLAO|nr:hypothetical protein [Flavobacterium cerinum]RWX03382.1 hypothetical protein EPI11_00185 [Flavobacterium cerinum]
MTLPFSTQINGKPTYFMEKIATSLKEVYGEWLPRKYQHESFDVAYASDAKPKHHTIREDLKNRWKVGMFIHFVINNRTPNRFQFAPSVFQCKSIQEIEILHLNKIQQAIMVDGRYLTVFEMENLAENDGFDCIGDFFTYFNKDFKGKIIHWTDLKY